MLSFSICRFELALQQNEIMDVFHIDWLHLGDALDTFGNKADNHLKVTQTLRPKIHNNLFITWFVITQFYPKNV